MGDATCTLGQPSGGRVRPFPARQVQSFVPALHFAVAADDGGSVADVGRRGLRVGPDLPRGGGVRALGFARPGLRRRGHLHRLRVVGRSRHSRHAHADVLPGIVQPRADFRDVDDVVSGRGAGDDGGRGETREGQPESLAHPSFARVGVQEGGVDRPGSPGPGAFPGAFRSLLNCFLDGSRSPRRVEDPEPARRGEGEAHRLKGLRGGGAFGGSGRSACATMTPRRSETRLPVPV